MCQRGPNSAPAAATPLPQYRASYPFSLQKIATPGSNAAATDRRHATASVRAAIVASRVLNCEIEDGAPHDKTRYNPGSAQTRGFDPSQADHDEWATFLSAEEEEVELHDKDQGGIGPRRARA